MKKYDYIKSLIFSYDTYIGALIGITSYYLFSDVIPWATLKETYNIAINVLAILFSIFFAALAIIVSVNDSKFISFLEEDGLLSTLISFFKFSLFAIFIMLIITILLYIWTVSYPSDSSWGQCKIQFSFYLALFFYSMSAIFLSCLDALKFFRKRLEFSKKFPS